MQVQFEADTLSVGGLLRKRVRRRTKRGRRSGRYHLITKAEWIRQRFGCSLEAWELYQKVKRTTPKLLRHAMPTILPPDPTTQTMDPAYWHQVFMAALNQDPSPCRNVHDEWIERDAVTLFFAEQIALLLDPSLVFDIDPTAEGMDAAFGRKERVKDDLWGKPIPSWRQKAEPFTVDPSKWATFLKSQQKS